MPVIQFTEGDRLAGKVMEKGGYSAEVAEIDGPKASASQKSVTFFTTFRITEGKYLGKELTVAFNTGTNSSSMLGNMHYAPHRDLMKVAAAVQGVSLDSVPLDLDTDTLKNKGLDLIVDALTSDGNIVNMIINFLPKGAAATFKSPF